MGKISEKQYTFMVAIVGILIVLSLFLILSDFIEFRTGNVAKDVQGKRECFVGTCNTYYRCGEAGSLQKNTCTVNKESGTCDPIEPPNTCQFVEEVCNTKKVIC
ncbi:MAG: hypothetical protein AABW51_00425 [Nanoarchaeota archaeon]